MANFRVTWEIDIEGVEDAHAAAVKALEMQRNPESTAVVFMVEKAGNLSTIDILSGAYRVEVDLLEELEALAAEDYTSYYTSESRDSSGWDVYSETVRGRGGEPIDGSQRFVMHCADEDTAHKAANDLYARANYRAGV